IRAARTRTRASSRRPPPSAPTRAAVQVSCCRRAYPMEGHHLSPPITAGRWRRAFPRASPVGVEMTIARNPLHRSGRAALPHPAPALGDNAEADEGIGMADTCGWKPPVDVSPHPFPRQMMRLAAAREGPPPAPADGRAESANAAPVHGNPVVPHVAPNDRAQISAHRRDGLVPTPPKVDLHGLQLRLPPRAHRLPQHRELPLPRLPATVREAENVEALGSPVAPASPADRR